jgi:hypothetical protein
MDEALLFCHICGQLIEPWDERADYEGRLAHALCVTELDDPLDPEWMEDMGYEE